MDEKRLRAWVAEGLSLEQIGRLVGRHPSTVAYWLAKFGLSAPGRDKHMRRGPIERAQLETLVEEGASLARMAETLARSKATVRHWLARYGLETVASRRRHITREAAGQRVAMPCRHHGLTEFQLTSTGTYRCLRCRAEAVTRRRRKVKAILTEEAGGACALCGYDRCAGALHFHHLDPATKSFELAANGVARSLARARAEAAKCVLLCSNCHAEVESGTVTLSLTEALVGLRNSIPG